MEIDIPGRIARPWAGILGHPVGDSLRDRSFRKGVSARRPAFVRKLLLSKLNGLSEYDVRLPFTYTETNLLGSVKHLSISEAWYFGEVFGRPFPGKWRRWDKAGRHLDAMWVAADESRTEIVGRYLRAWEYSDTTIASPDVDAPGNVPWWPRPHVKLFNVMV